MNRLASEPSLYLRQHATNPVDWYPWGEEALARAKSESRPIFLSIGYASCHWCHVMEREVFEDEEVATVLNRHFVAIKVDREERPDIDAAYLEAVQAMTGSGGWPLSVFLTPHLEPLFGGTYIPRERFLALLEAIVRAWTHDRDGVGRQASRIAQALRGWTPWIGEASVLSAPDVVSAARRTLAHVDFERGGLSGPMKFPTAPVWRFLLHVFRKTEDDEIGRAVRTTLDAMASGGMHDQVGGGFHRYATDPDWVVPHFEKMLYDQALLADLYLEASVVFGDPTYRRVARDVLDFVLAEMHDGGGFFASLDADSAEGEGAYYTWSPEDLWAALGPEAGARVAGLLRGVTDGGKAVLTLRAEPGMEGALEGFHRHRDALRAHRSSRARPTLDRKVVCAWNGLAIEAFARAGRAWGETGYLDAARRAADHLWRVHRDGGGRLLHSSYGDEARNPAILEDHAMLARGLIALHEASGEAEPLVRAVSLCETAMNRFRRPDGLFSTTEPDASLPVGSGLDVFDNALPSANAVMAEVLLRLAALTGREAYRDAATQAIQRVAPLLERAPTATPAWHDAALLLDGPLFEVVIAGDPGEETASLARVVDGALPFHAVVCRVPAAGAVRELLAVAPALEGRHARNGRPTVHVCERGRCLAPIQEPDALARILFETWPGGAWRTGCGA